MVQTRETTNEEREESRMLEPRDKRSTTDDNSPKNKHRRHRESAAPASSTTMEEWQKTGVKLVRNVLFLLPWSCCVYVRSARNTGVCEVSRLFNFFAFWGEIGR